MKKYFMYRLAVSILLLCFVAQVNAQIKQEYPEVSILLVNGEQLFGTIKNETLSKMNKGINFKASTDTEFKTYKISDFTKLQFENGETYEVLQVALKDTLERILSALILRGKVSVYAANYNNQDIYVLIKDAKTYCLQNDELKPYDLNTTKHFFRNTLYNAIKDGSISEDEVKNIPFDKAHIIALVTKYNSKNNSESEIIEHKIPNEKFIIAGINGNIFKKDDAEGMANILYRLYSPRISKSSSLNIGLRYSYRKETILDEYSNKKYNPTYTAISAPIFLQQNILNKKIRPYFSAGIALSYMNVKNSPQNYMLEKGFQQNYGISFLYGVGLEIDVYKQFMFKSDFYDDALDHLIMVGFAYRWSIK